MKRFKQFVLVCVCVLVPVTARANDGGWLEWLEKMSGWKMIGIGSQIHLACLNDQKERVACERWYGMRRIDVQFEQIKHEFDFRFGYYRKYGALFSDVDDDRTVNALKLMATYNYHVNSWLELGAGAGYMPFFGEGFDVLERGIITPIILTIAPFKNGAAKGITLRAENTYLFTGFTGADLRNTVTTFRTSGEWQFGFAIGYDFRRK